MQSCYLFGILRDEYLWINFNAPFLGAESYSPTLICQKHIWEISCFDLKHLANALFSLEHASYLMHTIWQLRIILMLFGWRRSEEATGSTN